MRKITAWYFHLPNDPKLYIDCFVPDPGILTLFVDRHLKAMYYNNITRQFPNERPPVIKEVVSTEKDLKKFFSKVKLQVAFLERSDVYDLRRIRVMDLSEYCNIHLHLN